MISGQQIVKRMGPPPIVRDERSLHQAEPDIRLFPRHAGSLRGRAAAPTSFWLTVTALCFYLHLHASGTTGAGEKRTAPYPASPVIAAIDWDWKTHQTAAPGSDLWPATVGADNELYLAWGDGGGFGGTDQTGRVATGFARIQGPPEKFVAVNINGGHAARYGASFPDRGKTGGLLAVGGRLYAWLEMENGKWPAVDQALIWSDDQAATWTRSTWLFPKGRGNLKPATFLNFGGGGTAPPAGLEGYVFFYGQRETEETKTYLGRVPAGELQSRDRYEFLKGFADGRPLWSSDPGESHPVFVDANHTGDLASVVYVPGLRRYLLGTFHKGPGQLGVFDAPEPWGPWTTVAYEEDWGGMGPDGVGLTCSFPQKWMSADGRTLWCIFSVYGNGAKQGINAHDKFNLIKASLRLK